MKILIIDDERSIRNSLKEILGDEGHDVDVAEDGQGQVQRNILRYQDAWDGRNGSP